jgi:hypothetical protein
MSPVLKLDAAKEAADEKAWRQGAARDTVTEHRAALLQLDPKGLSERETVFGFAILTKAKNLVDRRLTGFRKGVDALLKALPEGERMAPGVVSARLHHILWGQDPTGAAIAIVQLNGAANAKVLSEDKAFALLKTKKASLKRAVMEKPLRPPQPPPRFSPQKFRDLVAVGAITQAEYDACLDVAQPQPSVTVDVPPEIEEAIARTLFQPPPVPEGT